MKGLPSAQKGVGAGPSLQALRVGVSVEKHSWVEGEQLAGVQNLRRTSGRHECVCFLEIQLESILTPREDLIHHYFSQKMLFFFLFLLNVSLR